MKQIECHSIECLNELFRNSHAIQEISNKFQVLFENLQEISMNAGIAAGHAGDTIRVFSEIAKQIGVASNVMSDLISEMRRVNGLMINRVLECIVKEGQRGKFIASNQNNSNSENYQRVTQVITKFNQDITALLELTSNEFDRLVPVHARLIQVNDRVWSIVMNLRISAGLADPSQAMFFISIAEALGNMNQETKKTIDQFESVSNALSKSLNRGDRYAA